MVLTVTEDTPADMLAGSMELLVQLPREHHLHTQRVTVQRSTPMMDLLVQIATAHKLAASSYTLQAIGERGLVLPHQPNTPIGALDALQVKLLPKQGTFVPRKTRQANQPFETTFRLQVHLPRNQLYVSRVSPKMNLGEILDEVCREKNLDRNKYELRHPANLEETLDLSLALQDYHLQEVTLYAKQGRTLGSALSSQDIMALQRQEERRRQQAKQSVFGFMFKKSKESSLSTDSLGGRSVSPARSDETGRSASPLQPPARPQRKRRPAPKPPVQTPVAEESTADSGKDKMVISHSRNSSDSSGYHEASVLSDNPESARLPETLPRRSRAPGAAEIPRKLAHTSQSSKSLGNLATTSSALSHGTSSTSLSSTGLRKKRAAPPPPLAPRPLSSAVSTQALERIVDSEESLTSDMDHSKPPSDIGAPSKASSDIDDYPKASSDIGTTAVNRKFLHESASKVKTDVDAGRERDAKVKANVENETRPKANLTSVKDSALAAKTAAPENAVDATSVEDPQKVDTARIAAKRVGESAPLPKPRKANLDNTVSAPPKPPKRRTGLPMMIPRSLNNEASPSETDILLQKVSDTLSNSLPASKATATHSQPFESNKVVRKDEVLKSTEDAETTEVANKPEKRDIPAEANERKKSNPENDIVDGTVLNASTPNITAASQQDTSDYVSAVDEDLSICDWEYQLPAPPSAFRDTNSPVFDGYDTITLRSVEAFKEPDPAKGADKVETGKVRDESEVQRVRTSDEQSANNAKLETQNVQKASDTEAKRTAPAEAKSYANMELKREIISELESKIETGNLSQAANKDVDSKRIERSSAPKIAPVDNTLSNFTITTYTKQKSIDIFDDADKQPSPPVLKRTDERIIKTFATMPRNETMSDRTETKSSVKKYTSTFDDPQNVKKSATKEDASTNVKSADGKQAEPKIPNQQSVHRPESVSTDNDKVNIQRSKSYISMTSNEKYKNMKQEDGENVKYETDGCMKKSTSINNLNAEVPRNNEKFSHWRDNILKRQEEPTKEKQLQSLQVLKSILPQLKNAQQAEENVFTESGGTSMLEDTRHKSESNEHSTESNAVSTREQVISKPEPKSAAQKEAATKRYTYAGPPTINLGSWSERPSSNVQIKMDTDYKFGRSNVTGAKTIVNINGTDNKTRDVTGADNVSRQTERNNMRNELAAQEIKIDPLRVDKKEPDELARKLITHTTASGFKKPSLTKVSINDMKSISRHDDKPVVTGVELKKAPSNRHGNATKDSGSEIDTTPVNFKELTKAFGQDICLRAKPKRANAHRHSDYGVGQSDPTESASEFNSRHNGHVIVNKTDEGDVAPKSQTHVNRSQSSVNLPAKKFTSVVGIHASGQNTLSHNGTFSVRNGTSTTRINAPMPIVKGFKIQTASTEPKTSNVYVNQNGAATDVNKNVPNMPKPPTMPVITGVTLKSASGRPKSMPVNVDSRDTLLESIRNFGGREKLKSAGARY